MGRPLNKKYFANTNYQDFGTENTGGESIASVTAPAGTLADLVNGTYNIPAGSIGAPQLPGGAKPKLSVTVTGATAYTVNVVSAGSGYTSAPTITFNGSVAGGTGSATPVATLTSNSSARQNGIKAYAFVKGGSSRVIADIVKQSNDRSYKVITAEGTSICRLRTDGSNGEGTMDITAYDSDGGEYWVWKLTARKVVLVQKGVSGGTQFATGSTAKWVFRALTGDDANNTVKIDNN